MSRPDVTNAEQEAHFPAVADECQHELYEMDSAVVTDGYCPICQAIALERLRADRDRLREALKVAQPAITQAMDCIRGETPEDCSPGEAEDSTFSKLRDADAAIDEALQSSTGAA